MKKILFTVLCSVLVFSCSKQAQTSSKSQEISENNNQTSYIGIYKGTLPCADCSGIVTTLELTDDHYVLTSIYVDRSDEPFEQEGEYSVEGNIIILDSKTMHPSKYMIGDNSIKVLDGEGLEIEGELKDMYVLEKI